MTAVTASTATRLGQRVRQQMVQALTQTTRGATAVFAFSVYGLPVAELERLRRALATVSAEMVVVKNSLGRRALVQAGWASLEPLLTGTSGLGLTQSDPVAVSKVLVTFANEHAGLTLRGAVVDGQPLALEAIQAFAVLPSREALLAKVVGGMQAPIHRVVGALSGITRRLVTVVDAIRQRKQEESSP